MSKPNFLFEVSWEVCNKVGGIYTVLRSKAREAINNFSENYILIGPWLETNHHFVERSSPFLDKIANLLATKKIKCRVGYWDVGYGDGNITPQVILVAYKDHYQIDALLYQLWSDYGVDSLASNFEYYEPILFSTTAAEAIKLITENLLAKDQEILAHFHEWLCGAGLLYLKKQANTINTVFTIHATVLGRALSGTNRFVYELGLGENFDPDQEAKRLGVFAKHSLEVAAAREANSFTAVSNITADEAVLILNKYPDKITPNGLDLEKIVKYQNIANVPQIREKLLAITSKVIGRSLPPGTLLWVTSGRYEFHNKGFDILLSGIAALEQYLKPEDPEVVVFFLIAANHRTQQDSLLGADFTNMPEQQIASGIATHKLFNPQFDPIINACNSLGLKNPAQKIHVVYSDAYLDGMDGVFDLHYEEILANCDLSLFLSFYEPWGYTPLESIGCGTPTITTDLSGFGSWVLNLKEDYRDAIYVLARKNKTNDALLKNLNDLLMLTINLEVPHRTAIRDKAIKIAKFAGWDNFYQNYLDAYAQAIEFNDIYYAAQGVASEYYTLIHDVETSTPRFRIFQNECVLPDQVKGLRDIAYNVWWSWHDSVKILFQAIDPILWDKVHHNPVHFLNKASNSALLKKVNDVDYMQEYQSKLHSFQEYCSEKSLNRLCSQTLISHERPIAYFCMEYGFDECLPIYSGGLGILAADYLKTISDVNMPLVAIGLFYKQGYFHQSISFQNEQVAIYETQDINQIPMRRVNDVDGKPVLVSVEILDRTVHVCIWEIKVGRNNLYLLDSDVPENTAPDREITKLLYGGTQKNRLEQEMILGMAGARFIADKLNIKPAIYHLNEGHSAFLLLERIKDFRREGLTFEEAVYAVRSSSVFTTHTAVSAGNEAFSEDLIRKYFAKYPEFVGVPIETILNLARVQEDKSWVFSMTSLALKLTAKSNGVSRIHGEVARKIWGNLWAECLESETPITDITNGIHLSTWIGNPMKLLYDEYLGRDWKAKQSEPEVWEKIFTTPEKAIWDTHQTQKERLLDAIRDRIIKEYPLRNEGKQLINDSLRALGNDVLLIGLARRFVAYKRNTLILRDPERLAHILTNSSRPIVLVIAGKAHPSDSQGKALVQEVLIKARNLNFQGRVIFLEEYDITLAKLLTQGVDVWLNTPILNTEACGTSGMKVALNGGLNFSIKDGWWGEAASSKMGWDVESFPLLTDAEKRNDMENMYLLDTLEYTIAPLYYNDHNKAAWIEKMKGAISEIAIHFSSQRMVHDYWNKCYCPLATYLAKFEKNNFAMLKTIVSWEQDVITRFNTVKIKTILISGVKDGKIVGKGPIKVQVLLFSGKLNIHELKVELILTKVEEEQPTAAPLIIEMKLADTRESGVLTYITEYTVEDTGFYSYGVRVFPYSPELMRPQDVGVVYWG